MTTDDLDAIRARAEAARQAAASGTTGTPPNVDGPSIHDALDIFAESAEDVPALLIEAKRLRALLGDAGVHYTGPSADAEFQAEKKVGFQEFVHAQRVESERDRLAATVDRVRALLYADTGHPHGKGYRISPVALRAAIEGTDS